VNYWSSAVYPVQGSCPLAFFFLDADIVMSVAEYTSRKPRSSDQALRGDFFGQPQRSCSGITDFTSITLATHSVN
jgi:hypothetical protein